MAVSSNSSRSPSPATSRSNPNSRNSEINNTVRRSFSGNPLTKPSIVANPRGYNPVTPANSPSDFPQRHSIGKESGVPSHHYDKKNKKHKSAKPVRIRSRDVSKGTKNFMSLTVSAASKIAACPRKKVLLEKSELVRTSLSSFSDGKSPFSSVNLQKDQSAKPVRIRSRAVSKGTKNFMSLTISAASKIVACPRKKVLPEKNELVRTSQSSFSDGKNPLSSVNLQKDQNAKPVRVAVSKGTRNFRSLTISAASKIAEACPKKKVLLEKNEVVQTSLSSFSDGKSPLSLVNLQEMVENSNSKSVSSDSTVINPDKGESCPVAPSPSPSPSKATKGNEVLDFQVPLKSKNDSESLSETITMESDRVGVDVCSRTRLSPLSSTSIIALVDADPSLAPYDPKTNYLAPRPHFLYYKPNPRIKKLLNKGLEVGLRECKQVEDSFTSESLSDSETTEDLQRKSIHKIFSWDGGMGASDADPSLAPYDPKTNYLAPRPHFLYYKPNPRIKKLLNKGLEVGLRECKQVEDSFTSESLSDSETTEDLQRKSIHKIFSWDGGMGAGESSSVVIAENVPSEFPRRHSIGKESGVPSHHYDKENEKDQNAKPVRIRSPAVSKGTKNFMSPTISAASKIAASPRKKVLLEKNELVRTTLSSFSDGKSPLSSVNLQEVVEDSNSKSVSSDSTVINPDKRESCPVAPSPSPSKTSKGNEVLDFQVPLKSKNDSESLSETITVESDCVGIDVCSKTRPSPSLPSTSIIAPLDADPSLAPYDPKTNYLSPRPRFLHYKPNPRIKKLLNEEQEVGLRECMRLEDSFTSESLSDTEATAETQSEDSSSVEPIEGQNQEEEESEAALAAPAQEEDNVSEPNLIETHSEDSSSVEPIEGQNQEEEESEAALAAPAQEEDNVSEPNLIDIHTSSGILEAKLVSKSYSCFRLKPISLLLLLLVGCLWIPITDSPFISSVIDSSVGKESSFTKSYEPAELAEFARTNLDGLTRNFRLWSANTVSYFSKMIPIVKESNELSCLQFGNFTDTQVDLVGCGYLVKENQQNLQWPMKQLEVGIVQMKEQGNLDTEASYEKGEEASQVNPEFEEANSEVIEPDNSELEQIQGEHHVASHIDLEQASQGKPELEEASHSLQAEVVESHNSEVQQTEEESGVAFHIDHEAQSIIAEKEQEVQVSQASEIKPETVPEAEKLQGENILISHAEVEVQQIEEECSVASHIDHEALIAEKEREVQASQVSEIKPDVPEAEELHGENKLISHAEVESSGTVFEPESSESVASTANSQSFKELYQPLEEKSAAVNILGISLLIIILTVAAAFIFVKQQRSPTPSAAAIPMDQLLAKKLASIPTASVENTHQERLSSRNWPTEVDMVGESCPSEMSSFQRSTSYSKKGSKEASPTSEYSMSSLSYSKKGSKGESEAQSKERGLRKSNKRESLASSSEYSMGSPSYGSFTSYEKIHSKHGCGDEEVVTPVRRSSRIRNQVTSP